MGQNESNIDIDQFNQHLFEHLNKDIPYYKEIVAHLIKNKGKQLRPKFSLLCARLGGKVNERSYRAAMVVEMLHTASLIHDDIVDNSMERRGAVSINAQWGNKKAVFSGDIISLNALLLTLNSKDYDIFEIYAKAVEDIVNGELLQLRKTRGLNLDENIYFDIIKAKTASFFSAACASGALTTFAENEKVEQLAMFGEKVGIAFQIKDDLFGFGSNDVGKPNDNDIKEKKMTLPIIYALNKAGLKERRKLSRIIKKQKGDDPVVQNIIDKVIRSGGIEYTTEIMMGYKKEALDILHQFPASNVRNELEGLVQYSINRSL